MGVRIKPKRSETSSSTPGTSDIEVGEIAVNITDQKIFIRKSDDNIIELANATGISDVVDDTSPQLGGNLDLNGNDIVSTSNADIDIIPNGTGDINLGADTVQVGDNNANATITTQGTGDLILNTNNGTNSGTISILDGANGNITITPNGSGNVVLDGLSFPNSDGSAGQFLKTDGSAALSFASVTSSFTKMDAITTDGSTAYTLNVSSSAFTSATTNGTIVSVNGVTQAPVDAYSISGSTITFTESLSSDDVIDYIIAIDTQDIGTPGDGTVTAAKLDTGLKSFTEDTFTGDGSDTTFTLSVAPPSDTSIMVFLDGVSQPAGNYSVSSTTLTFSTAPPDSVAIRVLHLGFTGSSAAITDGGVTINKFASEVFKRRAWEEKDGNFTAVAGGAYLIDVSSAALTATLPASPSLGDEVRFLDATGSAGTNNITVGRNSQKINGNAADLTVSTNSAAFLLVYYNSTYGWRYTEV